jgi:hypothetical protein
LLPATTVLAAPVGHIKDVCSLGDVRSLGHSAICGAKAAGGPSSDQSASAIPESPACFGVKVIILDFDHSVVLGTAPLSVLKLPMDWLVTKVPALSSIYRLKCSGQSAPTGRRMATRQLANRRIDPVLPTSCFPDRKWVSGVVLTTIFTAVSHTDARSRLRQQRTGRCAFRNLLQPTRRAKATLRDSTGADYRQDLDIHNLLPTFALAHDSTLILVLCVPPPRPTNARKARTVLLYRMTAAMCTALSLVQCFLATSKELPANILNMVLSRHGIQDETAPHSIRALPR